MSDTAFKTQYRDEFVAAFEASQTVLRKTVTTDATIQGQSAEAGTLGIVVPTGTGIWWTYDVTNVSQNPNQIANPGLVIQTEVRGAL